MKMCRICNHQHDSKVSCADYQAVDDMFKNMNYQSNKGYRIEPTKNLGVETARKSKKHWNEQAKAERAKLLEKYKT